ncbi:MAG: GIY-YIG nuclease family protein [Methylocystis sp.]|nr:GIY-YIG nuclease family protein [Methylocystis sp.]
MNNFVRAAAAAPAAPGAYVLLVEIDAPLKVAAGQTRDALLAPGRYLYCGSANGPGGLRARLARHMRRGKSVRWHVDQLTEAGTVAGAWIVPGGDECALSARLSHLPLPLEGFGSSDCTRCRSHLRYWPEGALLDGFLVGKRTEK